jgi:solute carrier family 41
VADLIYATRYRSQTNEGRLDTPRRRKNIITNSLFFLQYQALSISALAGGLSWLLGYAMKHRIASPTPIPGSEDITEGYTKPGGKQLMLILSTGMLTASLSSAVLGNFISWLVVVCRWFGLNPGKSNLRTLHHLLHQLIVSQFDTNRQHRLTARGLSWRLSHPLHPRSRG